MKKAINDRLTTQLTRVQMRVQRRKAAVGTMVDCHQLEQSFTHLCSGGSMRVQALMRTLKPLMKPLNKAALKPATATTLATRRKNARSQSCMTGRLTFDAEKNNHWLGALEVRC